MIYKRFALILILCFTAPGSRADAPAPVRRFALTVDCEITHLPVGKEVRLWLPEPLSGRLQDVINTEIVAPAETRVTIGKKYGNQFRYLVTDAPASGKVRVTSTYRVTRRGVVQGQAVEFESSAVASWLKPNRLVPVASEQLKELRPEVSEESARKTARQIYDRVLGHVEYRKDEPGYGRGDTLWVCDSRFGNCTDFHSLFISLARTEAIPARFEIGLPLPYEDVESGTIGGYHCWAWFHEAGKGWIPVDISEADKHPEKKNAFFGGLPPNRISFSVGRDLILEPPQQGPPLNFFVYPYAEVDGEPVPRSQILTKYSWQRIETSGK